MNLTDLKEDFYKRFSASGNFLSYSRTGLFCPLLGFSSIPRVPALTCSLSMKIQLYGRMLEGNLIKLQSTKNNICIVFRYGARPPSQHTETFEMLEKMHAYGAGGAELFFDSSVPEFFNCELELKAAVFDVMSRIYDIDIPVSVCGDNNSAFKSILNAQKGCCQTIPDNRQLPLPLTGYKLLIIQTQKEDKTPRKRYIAKAYEKLRKIYPHIHSFSDLTPDRLEYAKNAIRDKTALNYVRHIVDENERITSAADGLEKCGLRALTTQMNLSEESIEKLWNPEKQHVFLAHKAMSYEGILCARIWKNGIISIASEENLDEAVMRIKSDFENIAGCKPYICIADSFGK